MGTTNQPARLNVVVQQREHVSWWNLIIDLLLGGWPSPDVEGRHPIVVILDSQGHVIQRISMKSQKRAQQLRVEIEDRIARMSEAEIAERTRAKGWDLLAR